MSPQSLQSREHVSVLGQLHLCLGVGCLGSHGEDIENKAGTVENLHFQLLLYIAYLFGRQLIIEDYHTDGLVRDRLYAFGIVLTVWCIACVGLVLLTLWVVDLTSLSPFLTVFYVSAYFLQFSLANICDARWSVHSLREASHSHCSGCIGQEFQLVKIFTCLRLALLWSDKPDEDCIFCFCL